MEYLYGLVPILDLVAGSMNAHTWIGYDNQWKYTYSIELISGSIGLFFWITSILF